MPGMMGSTGRRATSQKDNHHEPTIQEVITFSLRVQGSYRVPPEIPASNLQGNNREGQVIRLSTVQAERTNRTAKSPNTIKI